MSGRGLGSSILRPFWTADALKVVGYAMSDHMHTSLVCQAIDHGGQKMPCRGGCDDLSLGQGKSVHVSEVPGSPQGLRDSTLGRA